MSELAVNGVTDKKVYDGCFAPRRKEHPNSDMFKTIAAINEINPVIYVA